MQGGQGEAKHWAFNDPLPRVAPHEDSPPAAEEYRALGARVVDLHPITLMLNECVVDISVPMSLLAEHPDVVFNYLRPANGSCAVEMH
jgi:glucosamine-6-phosphate deaminase